MAVYMHSSNRLVTHYMKGTTYTANKLINKPKVKVHVKLANTACTTEHIIDQCQIAY